MTPLSRARYPFLVLLAPLVWLPGGVTAQEEPLWKLDSEIGGSLFYGASRQTSVIFKTASSYTGTTFQPEGEFVFEYGEGSDNEGNTFVNKRSWILRGGLRYITGGLVQPYVNAEANESFEKAIDLRTILGAGAVWTAVQGESNLLELALGGTWERTDPAVVDGVDAETTNLGRLSAAMRAETPLGTDHLTFTFSGRYQPNAADFNIYTWQVDTGLAFTLTDAFSLKLSLRNLYDSQAVGRGALDNNDGRILLSFVAAVR
jgi:hypothetical protein